MSTDRRTFLKIVTMSGGALVLGVRSIEAASRGGAFKPNAWLTIESDGTVAVRVGRSEMGQGVRTSLPMIVADELEIPLERVRLEQASPGPDFRDLGTGGSSSIIELWDPLRNAAAGARVMLIGAAAARWNVAPETLTARDGAVVDPAAQRRLSYGELAAEAARQRVPERPPLKERSAFRLIGQPAKRLDGPDIVRGRARYGLDVRVPGMLYAVVARAPRFGSKVVSFDAEAAKKVNGVRHVLQIPSGIAVVASNTWAAMRGREALKIVWSESALAPFDSSIHRQALAAAVQETGITIRRDGAGRAGFDNAAKTIEATYFYPFAAHASVEPMNSTAVVTDKSATVWSPTQTPNRVQETAVKITALPESAVTVHVMLAGGGFGRRLSVDFDREALEVARRIKGTPVQLVWSRRDDMRHGHFQAASAHRLRAALDETGQVVAWEHRKASTPHNLRGTPSAEEKANADYVRGEAWGVYDSPYFVRAAEMSYRAVDAPVPIGPWRAVFSPSSVFARECFIDEIAEQTSQDPLQLRLALLGGSDATVPAKYEIDDSRIDRPRLRKVLETVAARSGWGSPVPEGKGRGIACNAYHTGTYVAYVVDVSLKKGASEGELPFKVERVICALDCGVAVNPLGVAQQVESGVIWSLSNMKNEITFSHGSPVQTSYSDFPVVTITETPAIIETHIIASADERPHGLGEPTVCPLAPAVASALSRLTGRRIRALPVRAGDLLDAKPQPVTVGSSS